MKKLIITSIVFSSFIMTSCLPLVAAAGASYFGTDYNKTRKYLTNAKAIYDIMRNRADVRAAVMETRCVAIDINTGDFLVDMAINKGVVKLLASSSSGKSSFEVMNKLASANSQETNSKKDSKISNKKTISKGETKKNLANNNLKDNKTISSSAKNTSGKNNNNSLPNFKICETTSCNCEKYVLIRLEKKRDTLSKKEITYLSFSIIKNITKLEL